MAYLSLLAILLHGVLGTPAFGRVVVCAGEAAAAAPTVVKDCCAGSRKAAEPKNSPSKPKPDAGSCSCHCCKVAQTSSTDLPKPTPAGRLQLAGVVAAPFEPLLSNVIVLPAVPPPRA